MRVCEPPSESWEVATEWREGGTPVADFPTSSPDTESSPSAVHGGEDNPDGEARSPWCEGHGEEENGGKPAVISLGMLRTCFSEQYGAHIPGMFHDLLLDVGRAIASTTSPPSSEGPSTTATSARRMDDTTSASRFFAEPSKDIAAAGRTKAAAGVPQAEGDDDKSAGRRSSAVRAGAGVRGAPLFRVTEYDVTKGRYPTSWGDHAGYIIPGGVASACGNEPWMATLLGEVKGLRESGRPVLGVCLGHQVLAQALGGLVQPRNCPGRHYALQESILECAPPGVSHSAASEMLSDAVAVVRREKVGGGGGGGNRSGFGAGEDGEEGLPPPPPLTLLYHHNDEVVKLPLGATNISTSKPCEIHGMAMMASNKTVDAATATVEGRATSCPEAGELPPTLKLLSFQAHPELNYEYGRKVMYGMLDSDVSRGRITQEEASRLKNQVLEWDHEEFPVAVELMRRLFAPLV